MVSSYIATYDAYSLPLGGVGKGFPFTEDETLKGFIIPL
jgi:hypothetical protein